LEVVDTATRRDVLDVYRVCQAQVAAGVHRSRSRADRTAWRKWTEHCQWLHVPTDLAGVSDPVIILQLFAERVRSGVLAASGRRIKKRSVEQCLRSVAQIFASVGAADPRVDRLGRVDFRLRRQLAAYAKEDPAPTRVRPVPLQLLHRLFDQHRAGSDRERAIADLASIAFFFLLRPGEYCEAGYDEPSHYFRLRDVCFFIGNARYRADKIPLHVLHSAEHVSLYFTTQKNGRKGEAIGHGRSGHRRACPVRRLADRVRYLRAHGASGDTPLCATLRHGRFVPVTSAAITDALRRSAATCGDSIGIKPHEISARSMRAGGAMALLLSGVDRDTIKMVGRWASDAMLVHLHVSARPVVRRLAQRMHTHGEYALFPSP
jgi:hypothetical protein